jgi:hypothetical protein
MHNQVNLWNLGISQKLKFRIKCCTITKKIKIERELNYNDLVQHGEMIGIAYFERVNPEVEVREVYNTVQNQV